MLYILVPVPTYVAVSGQSRGLGVLPPKLISASGVAIHSSDSTLTRLHRVLEYGPFGTRTDRYIIEAQLNVLSTPLPRRITDVIIDGDRRNYQSYGSYQAQASKY